MKIETLDRASVKALSEDLNSKLAILGAEYGLSLRINGGTLINDTACKLNLEITLAGTDSVRSQKLADELKAYGNLYLPGIDLEKPLQHSSLGEIKIVGFNSRAHKAPVIAEAANGKRYKFEIDAIKRMAAR